MLRGGTEPAPARGDVVPATRSVAMCAASLLLMVACGGSPRESPAGPDGSRAAPPPVVRLAVQPRGAVDSAVVRVALDGIRQYFGPSGVEVSLLAGAELPRSAYYRPRGRYRAEKLLDYLAVSVDSGHGKVMGLTERDISTTKGDVYDWGIFGLGSLGGRSCVVSTFRLGRRKVSRELFHERLVKIVNHELGHTLGLDHCPTPRCLMQDARGTIRTVDGETGWLCPSCADSLPRLLGKLRCGR